MRAVILHGTDAHHTSNWFAWLKAELEKLGYEIWAPDLPGADHPNVKRYNEFLLKSGWDFSDNLIIGHSSGAVEILGLLQKLPEGVKINTAILVGSFTHRLIEDPKWEVLKGLFEEPFDFEEIKKRAKRFIFVHSSDDPYCPIEQAEYLHSQIGGEFFKFHDMGHFSASLDPRFTKLPELLEIIKEKIRP
jgi:predicted alpha/beta hydrolase family esterase